MVAKNPKCVGWLDLAHLQGPQGAKTSPLCTGYKAQSDASWTEGLGSSSRPLLSTRGSSCVQAAICGHVVTTLPPGAVGVGITAAERSCSGPRAGGDRAVSRQEGVHAGLCSSGQPASFPRWAQQGTGLRLPGRGPLGPRSCPPAVAPAHPALLGRRWRTPKGGGRAGSWLRVPGWPLAAHVGGGHVLPCHPSRFPVCPVVPPTQRPRCLPGLLGAFRDPHAGEHPF